MQAARRGRRVASGRRVAHRRRVRLVDNAQTLLRRAC
jgi:hypothetical protein